MNSKTSFKVTDQFEKEAFSRFVYENPNTSIFFNKIKRRTVEQVKKRQEARGYQSKRERCRNRRNN